MNYTITVTGGKTRKDTAEGLTRIYDLIRHDLYITSSDVRLDDDGFNYTGTIRCRTEKEPRP